MKEKTLMWIVIFATMITLAIKIAYDNYKQANKKSEVCYIDVPKIVETLAAYYSVDTNSLATNTTKEKADLIMKKLEFVLKNPHNFGCETIFMKGAIISGGRDITQEVLDNVWGKNTK